MSLVIFLQNRFLLASIRRKLPQRVENVKRIISRQYVKAQYPIPTFLHQGAASKKIDIPNKKVYTLIGKDGEIIKHIQSVSGARIQITRDSDADPNSTTRMVEIFGAPDAIAAAEKLISGLAATDEYLLKIPNTKVGLVIGKGGEKIRKMKASSGARIHVIPHYLTPGDTSTRTVKIGGTQEQIESAKQLVCQIICGKNPFRNLAMSGGYPQQGYQAKPPTNWAPPGFPAQQPGYGHAQPGAYSGPSFQYNVPQQQYAGYPPQPAGGYSTRWDQSTAPSLTTPSLTAPSLTAPSLTTPSLTAPSLLQSVAPSLQKSTQGAGYDYYSQEPPQQPQNPGSAVAPGDGAAYNYSQPPASGYTQPGQGYAQVSYGGYHAPPQSGYGQPPSYDQQQGYGHAPNYGSQANSTQVPPVQPSATQQGYASGLYPSPHAANYPPPGTAQPSYVMSLTSQASYGSQPQMPPGYGPPQSQIPGVTPPVYAQSQSPKTVAAGYGQLGYPPFQPLPSRYGGAYGPTSYGVAAGGQTGYGQAQPSNGNSNGTGYAQPPANGSDGNAGGINDGAPTETPQQGTVAKKSPPQS